MPRGHCGVRSTFTLDPCPWCHQKVRSITSKANEVFSGSVLHPCGHRAQAAIDDFHVSFIAKNAIDCAIEYVAGRIAGMDGWGMHSSIHPSHRAVIFDLDCPHGTSTTEMITDSSVEKMGRATIDFMLMRAMDDCKAHPVLPKKPKGSNRVIKELAVLCPGIAALARCPAQGTPVATIDAALLCSRPGAVAGIAMHLNDHHRWTREQVADWMETLDIDLSIKGW